MGQGAGEAVFVHPEAVFAIGVATLGGGDDFHRSELLAVLCKMRTGKAGSRQESFDAAFLPAIAGRAGTFVILGPRQWIMPPLTGDGIRAGKRPPVHNDPRANPGSQNHPKHDR